MNKKFRHKACLHVRAERSITAVDIGCTSQGSYDKYLSKYFKKV